MRKRRKKSKRERFLNITGSILGGIIFAGLWLVCLSNLFSGNYFGYKNYYGSGGNLVGAADNAYVNIIMEGETQIDQIGDVNQPRTCRLMQNYPNPFNPETTINYNLTKPEHVKLGVYNLLGQEVKILIDQVQHSGNHEIKWNGRNETGQKVESGIYLYQLQSENHNQTKKMIIVQ